jgi:hypothetical protein
VACGQGNRFAPLHAFGEPALGGRRNHTIVCGNLVPAGLHSPRRWSGFVIEAASRDGPLSLPEADKARFPRTVPRTKTGACRPTHGEAWLMELERRLGRHRAPNRATGRVAAGVHYGPNAPDPEGGRKACHAVALIRG